ncbi:MAG: hypothetical protein HOV81_34530 [Kofleriaceae bacterium]|nr:hypothetical protein [Kofleriaceae bacterium]
MRRAVPRDDFDERPTTVYERPNRRRRLRSLEEIAANYEASVAPFVLGKR